MNWRTLILTYISCSSVCLLLRAEHPEAQISNGLITAKMYLPDANDGYYRGTRFDWSGVIFSLTHDGHEYFGEWQQSDDPYLHDRITGPVNSFSADTEIDPGETFLRIGVGLCEKSSPQEKHPFRVRDHGQWSVRQGANWIEMVHDLTVPESRQGYQYLKRISLIPHTSQLVIDHVLTNTGQVPILTEVYNHNFFVIDGQPTGPDFTVRFPFDLTADRSLKTLGTIRGQELTYLREIPEGDYIIALLTGFSPSEDDHRFVIENRKTQAGVRMRTDRPMSKLRFWSPRTTLCPEPFIELRIEPDQSDRWSIRYTFYSLDE